MRSINIQSRYRIAACAFYFAQGMVYSSWASRNKDIKLSLGLDDGGWGNILLAAAAGQICAMALSGYLVSRYGSRFCLRIAVILYPICLIFLGLAPGFWILAVSLFFFGMTGNLHNISVNTQGIGVERLYHPKSILSFFHGMWSVGGFVAGAIGSFLMSWGISPKDHFIMVLGLNILILLTMGPSLLPRDKKPPEKPKHGRRFVKPDKFILTLGVMAFISMLCEGAMFNWSTIYMNDVVKANDLWVGLGYTAFMCTMATGRLMGDRIVNKFGAERLFRIGGCLTAFGFLLSAIFPCVWSAITGFMLVGLGVSSIVPICYSQAGKSKTMHPGVAVASISTIGFLGFLIGAPLIGQIARLGSLQWSFGLVGCAGFGLVLLVPGLKRLREDFS